MYGRVKDWLHGLRSAQPDREAHDSHNAAPMPESERFRIVHHLITCTPSEGGAGITPKSGEWKHVESIFPLHDHDFNKHWLSKWSKETFLKPEDLDEIRDRFGEKVRNEICSSASRTEIRRSHSTLPLRSPTSHS